ncbi:uncharacterized protein LOC134276817 [Saccostrea cucullata]|uniref:uncharacterized protein LOC134276817 n=1 Tax=Saccostrea cuccullata TaxID=36930 RepID=UPI002ED520BE
MARKHHKQTLRNNLVKKNDQLNHVKSELEKKKKGIVDTVEFMEENNSTMSNYSLIDNHRELTKMLPELEVHMTCMTKCEHSERFIRHRVYPSMRGVYYVVRGVKKSISCLSPSGSVSTVISTDPLLPDGICQSVDGGLLVTLMGKESDRYKIVSHSRRLMRHITMTGDVIHEYEYQEDGELVILSPSGHIKSVYSGQNLKESLNPSDIVCDSLYNILVSDCNNKQIHLLNPDGEFLKFLLQENEVNSAYSLTLYKSTLWVGYTGGFVKVFEYTM